MQRRGVLIRDLIPQELRAASARLKSALGVHGEDLAFQGRDGTGRKTTHSVGPLLFTIAVPQCSEGLAFICWMLARPASTWSLSVALQTSSRESTALALPKKSQDWSRGDDRYSRPSSDLIRSLESQWFFGEENSEMLTSEALFSHVGIRWTTSRAMKCSMMTLWSLPVIRSAFTISAARGAAGRNHSWSA
jgi:hypothetical protein